jgi:hypothetical protein
MRANRVAAAKGLRWLAEGFRVLRAAPLRLMALHLALLLAIAFMLSIPTAGFALFWLLSPALVVGPHAAARAAARGAAPGLALMTEGFRTEFPALLGLGGALLAALVAALGATALADDGRLFRAMVGIERLRIEDLLQPELHRALLVWALLQTAVLSVLWYAPLLVAWHRVPAAKAMFFSTAAVLLNWRAMLVFSGALTLALVLVSLLALAAATLVARTEAARISTAMFAATWTFLPVLFAASWRSYEAIFADANASRRDDTAAEAD